MSLRLRVCLILAVAATASLAGSSAKAQFFGGCGFGGYGFGSGIPYSVNVQDSPPYFAMYPPVYYSHPVPRPYGFSPFAYPPGMATPNGVVLYSSTVMPNRQARHRVKPQTTVGKTAAAPLVIENPFVRKEGQLAAKASVKPSGKAAPQPLVVYPLAQFSKQAKLARTDLDR